MKYALPLNNPSWVVGSLMLMLTACQSENKPPQVAAIPAPASASPPPAATATSWYYQYRTLLPGTTDSVMVHLQSIGGTSEEEGLASVVGFWSNAAGRPFELSGSVPASTDSLVLYDVDPSLVGSQGVGRVWHLRRQPQGWAGSCGGQPVQLVRLPRPVGIELTTRVFLDSIPAHAGAKTDSIYGHVGLHVLQPTANPALATALLRGLRGDTLDNTPAPVLATLWQKQRREFAHDYQTEVGEILAACNDEEGECPHATLRYTDFTNMAVLWNQPPVLSVGYSFYQYAGGAHGMYGTTVQSYDTRTGRPWRFADIFQPHTEAALEDILSRHARPALSLQPAEPLSTSLFRDTLDVTHNVYLTSGGVVFVYQPYEVASFAQGEIRLFVPFTALRSVLQPGLSIGTGTVARR